MTFFGHNVYDNVRTRVIVVSAGAILLLPPDQPGEGWRPPGGGLEPRESMADCARREVLEETGIDAARGRLERWSLVYTFEIYPHWRHRFAPGVLQNVEHVFALELALRPAVRIAPDEHVAFMWLPWREAAARCFSWSNRDAIVMLGEA